MKIGIIVLCRYNSSRLPGKILLKISGKTILQHIIDRLICVKGGYPICVATSSEIDDKPIIDYCRDNNINFFDGSKKNVASRFLNCAKANNFDYATRINGDNLFTDPLIIENMINIAKTNKWKFITNVPKRTYPTGVSVEIVEVSIMEKEIKKFNHYEKEHVMPFFYKNLKKGEIFEYIRKDLPKINKVNLAVDTIEDFQCFQKVFKAMKKGELKYTTDEIVNLVSKIRTFS